MVSSHKRISVAVISGSVGKTPDDIAYSFVFDETYRLAKRGISVHIVRSKIEEDSFSYEIHFHGIKRKIDSQAVKMMLRNLPVYPQSCLLRNPTTIYWENLYASNVSRIVKQNDIDLIHAHLAYPEGLVGLLAKKMIKKPLIITLHGSDILTEPSVGYGVRLDRRIDVMVKRILISADAVIAGSGTVFNEASKIIDIPNRLYLMPNGVDVNRFNPNLNSTPLKKKLGIEGRTIVFALRNHVPKNGLEYLIRAAPEVIKETNNVVFVIGGDGYLRVSHEQLAAQLGIKDKVIFTGKLLWEEVPYYYAMSDMTVVPSLQEAFGLVVAEAMACGKPVIGTKVGGIPDQIVDGHNGFLVQPRNSKEIAEKILWLINNPTEAKRVGANGRKIVEEKFNINKRIDQIIFLYKTLLAGRS